VEKKLDSKKPALVLENIRSGWNVGSIFRSCDALGFELILVGYTLRPNQSNSRTIHKTAIGAEKKVIWKYFEHSTEVFVNFKESYHLGIEINNQSQDLFRFFRTDSNFFKKIQNKKPLFWLGNEIHGLSNQVQTNCETLLHLKMEGIKESLNVASTACTIGYLYKFAKENYQFINRV